MPRPPPGGHSTLSASAAEFVPAAYLSAAAQEFVPGGLWQPEGFSGAEPPSAPPASPLPSLASPPPPPASPPTTAPRHRQKPCRFHDGRGGCRNGSRCPYLHAELPADGSNEIFVGGLGGGVTDLSLRSFFEGYGAVLRANVRGESGQRYGFVAFAEVAAAREAVARGHPLWDVQAFRAESGERAVLNPLEIRFTHSTISACFRSGQSVDDAIGNILLGKASFSDFPPMEVVLQRDGYYSLSNRRLFVARVLATSGRLKEVSVLLYSPDSERAQRVREGRTKWERSCSTKNRGLCVFPTVPCGVCRREHGSAFLEQQAGEGFQYHRALVEVLARGEISQREAQRLLRGLAVTEPEDSPLFGGDLGRRGGRRRRRFEDMGGSDFGEEDFDDDYLDDDYLDDDYLDDYHEDSDLDDEEGLAASPVGRLGGSERTGQLAGQARDSAGGSAARLDFAPGTAVRISGLQARPDLNGLVGRITKYVPEKERYGVELSKLGDRVTAWQPGTPVVEMAIKAANLEGLPAASTTAPAKTKVAKAKEDSWTGADGLLGGWGADAVWAKALAARRRGDMEAAALLAFEATMVDDTMGPPFESESTRERAHQEYGRWLEAASRRGGGEMERFLKGMEAVNRRLGLGDFGSDLDEDSDGGYEDSVDARLQRPLTRPTSGSAEPKGACGVVRPDLAPGTTVRIGGLEGRPELNGLLGRVACYVPEKERYGIELSKVGGSFATWQPGAPTVEMGIKAANLTVADSIAPAASAAPAAIAPAATGPAAKRPNPAAPDALGGAVQTLNVGDKVYFSAGKPGAERQLGTLERPCGAGWLVRCQDFLALEVGNAVLARSHSDTENCRRHKILEVRPANGSLVQYVRYAETPTGKPQAVQEVKRPVERLPLLFPGRASWQRAGIKERLHCWTGNTRLAAQLEASLEPLLAGQREADGHWVHWRWVSACVEGLDERPKKTLEEWNAINAAAGCSLWPGRPGTDRGEIVGFDVIKQLYGQPQRAAPKEEPRYEAPAECDFCHRLGLDWPECECGESYCSAACRLAAWPGHKRLCGMAVCGNQANNRITRLYWMHERGVTSDLEGMPLDIRLTPDYEPDPNELAASTMEACKQQ